MMQNLQNLEKIDQDKHVWMENMPKFTEKFRILCYWCECCAELAELPQIWNKTLAKYINFRKKLPISKLIKQNLSETVKWNWDWKSLLGIEFEEIANISSILKQINGIVECLVKILNAEANQCISVAHEVECRTHSTGGQCTYTHKGLGFESSGSRCFRFESEINL